MQILPLIPRTLQRLKQAHHLAAALKQTQESSAWCRTNRRAEFPAKNQDLRTTRLHQKAVVSWLTFSVPRLPPPHGSHPILPYLKDGVGVVIGLYVIQAHNTWQVSGAVICPGQLGLLVQVSDLLLCESGLQHILQNKRKFQAVLGQSIELIGHICNSNFYQKQKILCHEQPPKGFPTVGLRMEVTWNGPTEHCSSIKR